MTCREAVLAAAEVAIAKGDLALHLRLLRIAKVCEK